MPAIWISLIRLTCTDLPIDFHRLNPSLPLCRRGNEMSWPPKLSSVLLSEKQTDFPNSRSSGRQARVAASLEAGCNHHTGKLSLPWENGAVNEAWVSFPGRSYMLRCPASLPLWWWLESRLPPRPSYFFSIWFLFLLESTKLCFIPASLYSTD